MANTYLAVDAGLEILPVVNKIDLPSADPERVCHEIEDVIGIPAMDAPRISAKTGENVEEVMERIVTDIPAPTGNENDPLRALIFDSYYDAYRGVIVYVRIKDGQVKPGDTIRMMPPAGSSPWWSAAFCGPPTWSPPPPFTPGSGYIAASIKDVRQARVGDTVTLKDRPAAEPLEATGRCSPWCSAASTPPTRPLHRFAGRPGKIAIKRRLPHLRAGDLCGPGFWLPVRLSGAAAHGDHPGAAGAGVRFGFDHHRPQRGVQAEAHRRQRNHH